MHRHIRAIGAVHAEHSQREWMGAGKTSQAHERHRHRYLGDFRQFTDLIGGIGKNRAATDVDHRFFGLHDFFSGLLDLILVAAHGRIIAAQIYFIGIFEFSFGRAHVFGDVHQNRAGTAARGDIKSFLDGLRQIVDVFDEHVMLRARSADADVVGFLKCIVTDKIRGDLAGKSDEGNGIHVRIGQSGDDIGHAGARGHQHDSGLARGLGITFCHVSRTLFVTRQY